MDTETKPVWQTNRVDTLRECFWEAHPELAHLRRSRKRQNDYPADVRMAWVNYVDQMRRDGAITDRLAKSAIL